MSGSAPSYDSVFRPGLFAGQVHLVTGAGSGIGRCTAHELASLGATVALVGRTREKLERTAAEIAEAGGSAIVAPCDIREEEAVRTTVAEVLARGGRLDALVNNAGGQFVAPLATMTTNAFDAVIRNNLKGNFLVARECYAAAMREGGGAIVNVVADFWRGMPGLGHSGASRAGLWNLTMTMAVEWARSGVRVNAVAPGYVASSGIDTYPERLRGFFRNVHRAVPLQRQATVSEVAAAIVFLLSPAAAFISGATLPVDGAASLVRPMTPLSWLEAEAGEPVPAPVPAHDRSKPYRGFHLDAPPAALDE